jgi:branched-chain amino acid transport system substrate-binding protein
VGRALTNRYFRILAIALMVALFPPIAGAEIRIGTAGPLVGPIAWFGEQYTRGAGLAVDDLNAKGGVLGQKVELVSADDFCDRDQAVAAARKLVEAGVVFVAGHFCSHSSIAASNVYEAAGVLQIAPGSAAAELTENGKLNVFRVCGRDDAQGKMVADYIAANRAGKKIAVIDDGTTWGRGVADAARRRLKELGVKLVLDETFTPGEADYSALVSRMHAAGVDVFFPGGLHRETALIFRQAQDRDYDIEVIASSASATEDFPMIAGPAVNGTVMAGMTDARNNQDAAEVVARFRAEGIEPLGYTLYAYASVQVWAQAATKARSLDLKAVALAMHSEQFSTVLGSITFDAKGDVVGYQPWQWYVWKADGSYVPLKQY